MTVASFFRKYSYIQLLLQLCTEVSQVSGHNTTYNENLKLTSDAQLIDFRTLR
jgi:hypothetical protein